MGGLRIKIVGFGPGSGFWLKKCPGKLPGQLNNVNFFILFLSNSHSFFPDTGALAAPLTQVV